MHQYTRGALYGTIAAALLVTGGVIGHGTTEHTTPQRTATQVVTETPTVCLNALDFAQDLDDANTEGFEHATAMFTALADLDQHTLEEHTRQLDEVRITQLQPSRHKFQDAATKCRAQAGADQ